MFRFLARPSDPSPSVPPSISHPGASPASLAAPPPPSRAASPLPGVPSPDLRSVPSAGTSSYSLIDPDITNSNDQPPHTIGAPTDQTGLMASIPTEVSGTTKTSFLPQPKYPDTVNPLLEDEDTLSESQLRKLAEDEEIQRFLGLFSSHVHGVVLAPSSPTTPVPAVDGNAGLPETGQVPSDASSIELDPDISTINAYFLRKIIPLLPTQPLPFSQNPAEPFTMSKLQANATRLYVFFPAYSVFFAGIWNIASWKDWNRSASICTIYWFLWYFDLVLSVIFLQLLYAIVRRRYLPYPSLAELRERRASMQEAERFGQVAGLNYRGSSLGITEFLGFKMAWRMWRDSKRARKVVEKVTDGSLEPVAKEENLTDLEDAEDDGTASISGDTDRDVDEATEGVPIPISAATSVESFQTTSGRSEITKLLEKERKRAEVEHAREQMKKQKEEEKEKRKAERMEARRKKEEEREKRREEDWRKALMIALGEMADMHERVKNMFLWRNPAASRVYTFVFAGLTLFTLVTPARYIGKAIYGLAGFAFFFLVPFLRAMPDKDRARLPPAFADVPTDAQYAFGLVKERAQRGESLIPARFAKRKDAGKGQEHDITLPVTDDATGDSDGEHVNASGAAGSNKKDVEKWMDKSRKNWAWAEEGRRVLAGEPTLASKMVGQNVSSFPAHHAATLGTLHISSSEIWFTPFTLTTAFPRVPLSDIGAVKKLGVFGLGGPNWGGLEIKMKSGDVLKFPFVGSRNEAFAQLLAFTQQSWLRM